MCYFNTKNCDISLSNYLVTACNYKTLIMYVNEKIASLIVNPVPSVYCVGVLDH